MRQSKREVAPMLRVTIRTPSSLVLSAKAQEITLPGRAGHRIVLRPSAKPTLFAVAPGTIIVREAHGSLIRIDASWGMLVLADGEARILVRDATLHLPKIPASA